MVTKKSFQTRLLMIVGVIILLNVVADRFWLRFDFTADERYTLSKATDDILQSLDAPVTITVHFSEDLPPHIAATQNDFKELLIEYEKRSQGQVVYEFINPNESEEKERETQQQGIAPVMINVRERDQIKQQRAYLGLVVQMGEQRDVIPLIQPGAAMEYALSTSIKKLSVVDKPQIGILQGHGEPSIAAIQQAVAMLSVLYSVQPITLSDTTGIPSYYKTIAIIAPEDSFPSSHIQHLENYINGGGKILAALNRVNGDLSQGVGKSINTGLERWLESKGISIANSFLTDAKCGSVSVRRQQGFFTFNQQIQFPYFPLIINFSDHSITAGLESIMLPFASAISYNDQDTNLKVTVLASSSGKAGSESPNTYFDVSKQWTESDFPSGAMPVAIIAEGNNIGNNLSKMIVIGDGDFPVNGEGQNAQQLQPDNANLLVNAIEFLSDDTGLNELRTKGVTSRPIDPDIEDGTKTMIKYFNFLFPLLLILGYGVVRLQMRRRMKYKWMEIQY